MPGEKIIPWSRIADYRSKTFRFDPSLKLMSSDQAVSFVNDRGFVFFWPISGIEAPSLWGAVAGDRPVPNNHDDPAHITWRWKDNLLGSKRWYYGKILRQKSTIISLKLLPSFYALSPNYGDPEQDYLIAYHDGKLTVEEKQVFETLLRIGPLDSITLRKESRLSSAENTSRFNRALNLLMRDFRILPVGVAEAGSWKYAFLYDVVHRHFPFLSEKARAIPESEARLQILTSYFLSVGACQESMLRKIVQWPDHLVEETLETLGENGFLINQVKLTGKEGYWWLFKKLAAPHD